MPLFFSKKEVYQWIKEGKKTIEIRKGKSCRGEIAVFQAGPKILRLKIIKKETGVLSEIVRPDNFRLAIPSATNLNEAFRYLYDLYNKYEGIYTAYYLEF